MNWLSKLFADPDKRRARRHSSLPVIAIYWDGGLYTPHTVPDISQNGFFVHTEDRWSPRTLIRVTLRKESEDSEKSAESIMLQCRVARIEENGVGLAIMLAEEDKSAFPALLGSMATRGQLNKFLERLHVEATETLIPEP